MSYLRTAAQQALEAMSSFESGTNGLYEGEFAQEIAALKAALVEDAMQKFTDVSQEIEAALADGDKLSPGEPVAMDWLHKWANQDDGEPETQWHEGYEAARRVVQIHLTAPPQRPAEPVQECPNCASLEAQNTELDRKLAEMERKLLELQAAVLQSQGIRSGDA